MPRTYFICKIFHIYQTYRLPAQRTPPTIPSSLYTAALAGRMAIRMLHTLRPAHGSTQKRKRVARGNAAGGGTTAGRGQKGQQSRTGRKHAKVGFEGGQTPLLRRLPKLSGFTNHRRVAYEPLNLHVLERLLPAGSYSLAELRHRGVLTTRKPVKLLGHGAVTKAFTVEAHASSKGARAAIEAAGGVVTIVRA